MRIAILGTGVLARGLAEAWKNHDLVIAGRSTTKARDLAAALGATAAGPADAVAGADAVLLAVPWPGIEDMLALAGDLSGTALIDPVNAVEHGVGMVLAETSAAQRIAELAPGAHVVKAFHLFPASQWTSGTEVTVPLCGDDAGALDTVGRLVRDAGARPAVVGGLDRARQLEDVAGFVIALAFAGVDPQSALPSLPT